MSTETVPGTTSGIETGPLLEAAEAALAIAKRLGADDAAIQVDQGRSTQFSYRDGQLEKVQDSATRVLGAALYVDGRFSTHRSNDLRPETLEPFLRDAIALTRALEVDPHRRLPDPALYAGRTDAELGIWDDAVVGLGREAALDWLAEMDAAAHAHEAVISSASHLSSGYGALARVTSNGFSGTRRGTVVSAITEATVRDEGDKRPEAYAYRSGRNLASIGHPREVAERALRRALLRLGSEKAASTRTKMVLHREAAGGLIGRICGALSGGAIQQEQSFLKEKKGEAIASPLLSIQDDPWFVGGSATRDFDGEGLATRPRAIVENGVLRDFFIGTYYANKLGWDPTTGSPSNLTFAPGDKDADGLLAEAGDGIYVTGWAGGNADMTTGDFSFGIRGFRVEGGTLGAPISEMNVTGNYLDLLPRLVAVGNDPFPASSVRIPTLIFDEVQFSGA